MGVLSHAQSKGIEDSLNTTNLSLFEQFQNSGNKILYLLQAGN